LKVAAEFVRDSTFLESLPTVGFTAKPLFGVMGPAAGAAFAARSTGAAIPGAGERRAQRKNEQGGEGGETYGNLLH
jgi:hypothetical protein